MKRELKNEIGFGNAFKVLCVVGSVALSYQQRQLRQPVSDKIFLSVFSLFKRLPIFFFFFACLRFQYWNVRKDNIS